MQDRIIRGLLGQDTARFTAISGKDLCEKARRTHGLVPGMYGRFGTYPIGHRDDGDRSKRSPGPAYHHHQGRGPAGNIVCTAGNAGAVKGYIENPGL